MVGTSGRNVAMLSLLAVRAVGVILGSSTRLDRQVLGTPISSSLPRTAVDGVPGSARFRDAQSATMKTETTPGVLTKKEGALHV